MTGRLSLGVKVLGRGGRISLPCDSGSRISKEASRRETPSSLARGGHGGQVWTTVALWFSSNETPGDRVQRTKQRINGRSGTDRSWHPGDIVSQVVAGSFPRSKIAWSLDISVAEPINPVLFKAPRDESPVTCDIESKLIDRH